MVIYLKRIINKVNKNSFIIKISFKFNIKLIISYYFQ